MVDKGLGWYFIFPFLISALMAWGAYGLISTAVDWVSVFSHDYLQIEHSTVEEGRWSFFWEMWETMKDWINSGSVVFLAILLRILLWFLMAMFTKYILLILMSPVLAFLSEQAEEKATGNTYPFRLDRFLKDILRGVLVAIRNFFFEFSMIAIIWIISLLLPIIAPFTILATILISAYYYGFSMIDYVNERRRTTIGEGASFVRAHKGMSVTLGLFIALAMKIPLLGFLLASITSMLGAVAAVNAVHERIDLTTNPYAVRPNDNRIQVDGHQKNIDSV